MRRILPTAIFGIIIAGCTVSAKYDIDVQCWKDFVPLDEATDPNGLKNITTPSLELPFAQDTDETGTIKTMECLYPKYFKVQCDTKTYQMLDYTITCSTFDHQTVRVELIDRPKK